MIAARSSRELATLLRTTLADAVVIDLGTIGRETDQAVALAREFPSLPFIGLNRVRRAFLSTKP